MDHLFSIGLFIHIIGITCIAGGSIGGLVLETHIWKHIRESPDNVRVLGPIMPNYPVIIQAGTLLMLFSGLLMLGALGWTVAGQWWFIIKMVLVAGLVLNGVLVARPNGARLRKLVPRLARGEDVKAELSKVKRNMTLFHISELAMLVTVYLLAVFRF
jgi:hypothetical protein